jgi:hypothetical protein
MPLKMPLLRKQKRRLLCARPTIRVFAIVLILAIVMWARAYLHSQDDSPDAAITTTRTTNTPTLKIPTGSDEQTYDEPSKLFFQGPASDWTSALPIGNGRLGALLSSDHFFERIPISDDTLFGGKWISAADQLASQKGEILSNRPGGNFSDVYSNFKAAQTLLLDGDNVGAQKHAKKLPRGSISTFQYLSEVSIKYEHPDETLTTQKLENFSRELDLGSAVVASTSCSSHHCLRREYFSSAPDDVIALNISQVGSSMVPIVLGLRRILSPERDGVYKQATVQKWPVGRSAPVPNGLLLTSDEGKRDGLRFASCLLLHSVRMKTAAVPTSSPTSVPTAAPTDAPTFPTRGSCIRRRGFFPLLEPSLFDPAIIGEDALPITSLFHRTTWASATTVSR